MAVPTPSPAGAADDAQLALWHALALHDASPARYAAVTDTLILQLGGEAQRIAAATDHADAQVRDQPDDDAWRDAAALLHAAVARVRDAGADTDAQAHAALLEQIQPTVQPFRWPRARRRNPRWWLRRAWLTVRVRAALPTPRGDAGPQKAILQVGAIPIGSMDYQLCGACRLGYIRKIEVDSRYQGYDIGTCAVLRLWRRHRGFGWYTSVHYDTAGTFWTNLARRTGSAFTADARGGCPHMQTTRR